LSQKLSNEICDICLDRFARETLDYLPKQERSDSGSLCHGSNPRKAASSELGTYKYSWERPKRALRVCDPLRLRVFLPGMVCDFGS